MAIPSQFQGGSFYNSARTFEGDCHTSLVPQHCASEQPPKAALSESQCALARNDSKIYRFVFYHTLSPAKLQLLSFGNGNGQDDLAFGFPAFGNSGDAGELDLLEILGQGV